MILPSLILLRVFLITEGITDKVKFSTSVPFKIP